MTNSLDRFIQAQDGILDGYTSALAELRDGQKETHWIWYVFPQLRGLGSSSRAMRFGLEGVKEARAYLRHPRLQGRLIEASEAAADQVRTGIPLSTLMGSEIDTLKLVSSMTLFSALAHGQAADGEHGPDMRRLATAADALLKAAAREDFEPCAFTMRALEHESAV